MIIFPDNKTNINENTTIGINNYGMKINRKLQYQQEKRMRTKTFVQNNNRTNEIVRQKNRVQRNQK